MSRSPDDARWAQLLDTGAPASPCPKAIDVAAWVEGRRDEATTRHVSECDECREDVLAALAVSGTASLTLAARSRWGGGRLGFIALSVVALAGTSVVVLGRGRTPQASLPPATTTTTPSTSSSSEAKPAASEPSHLAPSEEAPEPAHREDANKAFELPPVHVPPEEIEPTPAPSPAESVVATAPSPSPVAPPSPGGEKPREPEKPEVAVAPSTAPPEVKPSDPAHTASLALALVEATSVTIHRGSAIVKNVDALLSGDRIDALSTGGVVAIESATLFLAPNAKLSVTGREIALVSGQVFVQSQGWTFHARSSSISVEGGALVNEADGKTKVFAGSGKTRIAVAGKPPVELATCDFVSVGRNVSDPVSANVEAPAWLERVAAKSKRPVPVIEKLPEATPSKPAQSPVTPPTTTPSGQPPAGGGGGGANPPQPQPSGSGAASGAPQPNGTPNATNPPSSGGGGGAQPPQPQPQPNGQPQPQPAPSGGGTTPRGK